MSQTIEIKRAIKSCIEQGLDDKRQIYTKVVNDLMVPRPTVRRVAREFRQDMLDRIDVLQARLSKMKQAEQK